MDKNTFLEALSNSNFTTTQNGASVYNTTNNPLLDLFSLAGAMRNRSEDDIIDLFEKSLRFDILRTVKYMFYVGDIRNGLGERRVFRVMLKHLAVKHPELLRENIELIPYFNRWDSIMELLDSPLMEDMVELIKHQLVHDMTSDDKSLMCKWLPSLGASNKDRKLEAKKLSYLLNLHGFNDNDVLTPHKKKIRVYKNEERYRKSLSLVKRHLLLTETALTEKKYDELDYSKIPSQAMNKYTKAFKRNDEEGFLKFCTDLKMSKATINSGTLFPYQIVSKVVSRYHQLDETDKLILNAQWNALPDYIDGADMNGICVVDTSGSMSGQPIEVALSLGTYCAERCKGAYKDKFITFSRNPQIQTVKGNDIFEKIYNMYQADWGMNTNIEKVFDLILKTALANNSKQSDMPNYLIIISDMEMDEAITIRSESKKNSLYKAISKEFENYGYNMPALVFWNVDAKSNHAPMTTDENGWISVSGLSPTIFKAIMTGNVLDSVDDLGEFNREEVNPIDVMLAVLDSEIYEKVVI